MARIALLIATLCAVAIMVSCGIPQSTVFLASVQSVTVDLGSTAVFTHAPERYPSDNFRGYEVYYKFYSYDQDPTDGPFAEDQASIAASAADPQRVEELGFFRMTRKGDTLGGERPLIRIDSDASETPYNVELQFPPSVSTTYEIVATWLNDVPDESPVLLVRDPDATSLAGEFTFEPDDINLDGSVQDIPEEIESFSGRIHMGIVVLAFGIDFEGALSPVYSEPVMSDEPLEIIAQE